MRQGRSPSVDSSSGQYLFSTTDTVTVESVNGGERRSLRRDGLEVTHAISAILMPNKHIAV